VGRGHQQGGGFDEILDLGEDFKKFASDTRNTADKSREVDEFMAHLFLEKKGETLTVAALRGYLSELELEKSHNVSFLEYALWKYKKTLDELFKPSGASPELIEALNKAIALYQDVLAEKKAREEKMAELEKVAAPILSKAYGGAQAGAGAASEDMPAHDEL